MKRASTSAVVDLSGPSEPKRQPPTSQPKESKDPQGVYWTKISELPYRFNARAMTLAELIAMINPVASIHFNFCVDAGYLISQYPSRLRTCPITIVVGETHKAELRQQVSRHFRNIIIAGAPLPIRFGTHHTKLSIFECERALHVVVSTANLIQEDWDYKTQGFYYCRGALDKDGNSPFREQLCAYLEDAYSTSEGWDQIEHWRDRLQNANFSHIKDTLIYSVPGKYRGTDIAKYGHRRLREQLAALPNGANGKVEKVIAQCSSIGSLGPEHTWFGGDFLKSLLGGNTPDRKKMSVIFPTVGNIRTSFEGYIAGGHFPYNSKNHSRQEYLMNHFYKWCSHNLGRSRAMPHIKTYTGLNAEGRPLWFLLTSANLSKAAWGELQINGQFQVRSYELGVLMHAENGAEIELPFDLPLLKYGPREKPWIIDENYEETDSKGGAWMVK